MENKKMKMQMGVIYGVVALLIFALLVVTVIFLANANTEVNETTASTTAQTTNDTGALSPSETTGISATETTKEHVTYPPAYIPTMTTQGSESEKTENAMLDQKTKAYLESLDNTTRGWGMGVHCDEENRPIDAVNAQKKYEKYNASYLMNDGKIYLTFDEGYENGYTAKILDALKEKNVKAVFFITMSYAQNEPALVRRMINEGHIVGNHSTKHLSFPDFTIDEAYEDVRALHEYVLEHFDYEMKLFRFPMGESSDRMQALLQEMGYTSLFWSFAYRDWLTDDQPAHDEAFEKITNAAHPGAIYLLHAVSSTNTELLPDIIDDFRAKGYEIALYPVK